MKAFGILVVLLGGPVAAQPAPNLWLESWRAYAMTLEMTDDGADRLAVIDGHFAYLAALDACHEGMARPTCWDRAAAQEIARLRKLSNGTLPDDAAIGPVVMECPGLPVDTNLTMIWGDPAFAVLRYDDDMRVLQTAAGTDNPFMSDGDLGPTEITWSGTEVQLVLDGKESVTCNVLIGED